jgi:hypothetical protein
MHPVEPSLESPVEEKISWARETLHLLEQDLRGHETFAEDLRALRRAVTSSRDHMARLGIADACRACEEKEGGSCCGAGIERHYSASFILLNLLLCAEIPETRQDPAGCFFLCESGCGLLARHVLCVNFLCQKITARISPQQLAALREKEGVELGLVFCLHETLRKKLNAR